MAPNELPTEEAVSPTEVAQMQQHHVHENTWAVFLILYKGGSAVKEEVVLLPLVQDWALHLSQAGHGCLLNLTVKWEVLVWEAQQKVEADHVLEEQEVSYYDQGLGLGRDQGQGNTLSLSAKNMATPAGTGGVSWGNGEQGPLLSSLQSRPPTFWRPPMSPRSGKAACPKAPGAKEYRK